MMGIVMIRCPATGREISTGIAVDRPRFECTPVFFAKTYCPLCRAEHQWFAKDAWVADPAAAPAA
jgi:transposase-like protein